MYKNYVYKFRLLLQIEPFSGKVRIERDCITISPLL